LGTIFPLENCPEDALCRVNYDPVCVKTAEESPEMSLVLLECPGENEHVIQVREAEVESPQHIVHEALERQGGVSRAEGHERKLE
jgi:hypothetical protein